MSEAHDSHNLSAVSIGKIKLYRLAKFLSCISSVEMQTKAAPDEILKKKGPTETTEGSKIPELTEDLVTDLHFSCLFPLLPFC